MTQAFLFARRQLGSDTIGTLVRPLNEQPGIPTTTPLGRTKAKTVASVFNHFVLEEILTIIFVTLLKE